MGFLQKLWFDTRLRGSLYYTDISDYQVHNYVSGLEKTAIVYNTDVELYGFELELTRRFTHKLGGYFTYTWQNWSADQFPLEAEASHYFMQNLPRNKVTMGVSYGLWENGLVTLNARWLDSRESKGGETIHDFATVDVGAQHLFELMDGSSFVVKGYVNNVTDEDYEMRYGYPMPGITAGISGRLNF
ncbi:MAG: hypothetical protein ACLFVT_06610 [Syntrophobacteria bacterium]